MKITKVVEERFWDEVCVGDSCWEWQGYKHSWGYGHISVNCRVEKAHRLSWEIHRGEIPEGMCVLHHCDNPPCVNPDHLFLGTHQDNMRDSIAKDRHNRGERHGSAKLTDKDILRIHTLYEQGLSQLEIADMYPVGRRNIGRIVTRERWAHVP